MIRIERVPLPDGLRALAHRDPDGGLLIYVSSTLDAPVQRIAVMAAVRASRQSEGRTAAPLGLALLAGLRLGLGNWRGAGPARRAGAAYPARRLDGRQRGRGWRGRSRPDPHRARAPAPGRRPAGRRPDRPAPA